MKDNIIIDCFAGGGGASVGIEMALGRQVDIAVNHDPQAIRMHVVKGKDGTQSSGGMEDRFLGRSQRTVKPANSFKNGKSAETT